MSLFATRRRSERTGYLRELGRSEPALWSIFVALSGLVLAYLVLVIVRGSDTYWTWLDGWVVCGIELTGSALCLTRALVRRPGGMPALFLGLSLLSRTIGDVVLTIQSIGGATPRPFRWLTPSTWGFTRSPTWRSCCSCGSSPRSSR